jgi:hypothetical protein
MEKEVVNFFHQSVEVAVWLVAHPRKHVVDRFFEACSSCARLGTKPKETVGEHLKVPVATGAVRITHLAA